MPATRNLTSSVLFALPFIGYQPANISNGEPALNCANLVKQTMLGAPFVWPWNRGEVEIEVTDVQDYFFPVTNYGYLEQVWLIDSTGKAKEIEIKSSLSVESAVARPQSCAVESQDDDGITIRLNTLPDQPKNPSPNKTSYTLGGFYQKAAVQMTSMASSWNPIPDNLSYIYDWGFLAMLSMLTKDVRLPIFSQKFVSHLLGTQDGLTATQRNIFIGEWLALVGQADRSRGTTQQGVQARSAT
jgi:hypothetical protein